MEVVGRHATRETFDQLHVLARNARTTEEKRRAYAGMQAAIDPVLAQEMIALSLGNELSATETARNLAIVAANEHPDLAWDFARQHADVLLAQTTFFGRNEYLPTIAQNFTDAARADELEAFVREHLSADFLPEMAKGADVIRLYAAVKQRELPAIDAWVKERVKLPE
jgi:aminopeptidase N